MNKKIWIILGLSMLSTEVKAQDAVLSLTDANIVKIETEEDEAKEAVSEAPKDDKGIFSFINFWKEENKVKETSASEEPISEKLKKSAQNGDLNAQLALGYMYLYGDKSANIEQDYKQAFKYYEMAAEQNDNVAINNLGSLYYSGIGTPRNMLKAAQMFSKAATLGNVESMVNLAFIYLSNKNANSQSEEAIRLFQKASEQGNLTANFMLGYAYYKGYVVKQNYHQAFNLIKKAANAGYDEAMYVLSTMYMKGHGTPQNYGNGVKILNKAVEQGNVPSMMELGYILATGDKYPRDVYKAHILFNIASVRGAEGAAERRDILEKSLKMEQLLQAQQEAEAYRDKPSELTKYIRQTFGENVRTYIDDGIQKRK